MSERLDALVRDVSVDAGKVLKDALVGIVADERRGLARREVEAARAVRVIGSVAVEEFNASPHDDHTPCRRTAVDDRDLTGLLRLLRLLLCGLEALQFLQ